MSKKKTEKPKRIELTGLTLTFDLITEYKSKHVDPSLDAFLAYRSSVEHRILNLSTVKDLAGPFLNGCISVTFDIDPAIGPLTQMERGRLEIKRILESA